MNEQTPVFANPLAGLGYEEATLLAPGAFSAVCARPGVGKTAFLVQMALWALSLEKHVLHVSLCDPIKKVDLWYRDLFSNLVGRAPGPEAPVTWAAFLPRRFIMTFKVEGFSVPKLEERLTDLVEQEIFTPHVMLLDGLVSDDSLEKVIEALKHLAQRHFLPVWFSVQTQQYPCSEASTAVPPPLKETADAMDAILSIEGAADQILVKRIKGKTHSAARSFLRMDPATLLLTDEDA